MATSRFPMLVLPAALALAAFPPSSSTRAEPAAGVAVEGGNITLTKDGARRTLTELNRDSEAALSPDGQWVIYTRAATPAKPGDDDEWPDCAARPGPDELRRIRTDGTEDELLLAGRTGDAPEEALCGFYSKQFSADGATLYFLSPAWATSGALHAFALETRTARYVMPANDYALLTWCAAAELKDAIVAQQHRYFHFGGSYDWYWLFDPSGAREIGPVGEFDSVEELTAHIADSGHCAP